MKILAIDLGKFNSVVCLFDTSTNQSEFETITPQRWALEQLLNQTTPDQIVIETSSITGWVHDFCQSLGYKVLVANPSVEAWRWKNVKRKTDKDDALKLARLSTLDQISAVYVPIAERRQYRLSSIDEWNYTAFSLFTLDVTCHYGVLMPPSMIISLPSMKDDSSEDRNTAPLAISIG